MGSLKFFYLKKVLEQRKTVLATYLQLKVRLICGFYVKNRAQKGFSLSRYTLTAPSLPFAENVSFGEQTANPYIHQGYNRR